MNKILLCLFFLCYGLCMHASSTKDSSAYIINDPGINDSLTVTGVSKKMPDLIPCPVKGDFNYVADICNPLSITFVAAGNNFFVPKWQLEDGATTIETTASSYTFSSYGNHKVTMIVDKITCADTVAKIISFDVPFANIVLTPDTTICINTKLQLRTSSALGYCWSPADYLDNPKSASPISSAPVNITYYCNALAPGNNLIVNGDFSQGNTGFTSEYSYATPNITEGQYYVGPNPNAWNPSMSACNDHTTGTGNMLLMNGSPADNVNVWKQTVAVTPNTNYAFSTWIQALWPPNPAQLQFSINGVQTGFLIFASLPTCTWTQFFTTWNSGNSTSAVISIVNKNTEIQGNDFALDDISFAPVVIKKDSVVIKVETPLIKTNNDTALCSGRTVQLNTTGSVNSFNWTPATGLSNTTIANPVATATLTTQYIVTGTSANGCIAKDTVQINVNQKPVITKTKDTTICHDKAIQLNVGGGNVYAWLPAATLSNLSISNPVAKPVANTTYYVSVTDNNSCVNNDSIKVSVKLPAVFTVSPDAKVCLGDPIQLAAAGGDSYTWTPATGLSNNTIANPTALPLTTTLYSVAIKESTCGDAATLSTNLVVLSLPTVVAKSSNDIDCVKPVSQLNASGALSYAWQPAASLNDSTIAAPFSSPSSTTTYIVKGTDNNGCSNYDSVKVLVTKTGDLLINLPNAFSPNGDYQNDCFGISRYAGLLQQVDFSVYDRFGMRLFHTNSALNCWDGRYKGKLQDTGGFVYILKASTFCGEIFKKGIVMLVK